MSEGDVTLRDIWLARRRLGQFVRKTPLVPSLELSRRTGKRVFLKLENLQPEGSFKIRGAANRMLQLTEEERRRGVICFSTGNHGRAVAYVARQLGIPAVVCLSRRVPPHRREAIERLGAELAVVGESQDEAEEVAWLRQRREGLTMIDPFDDAAVIAGQGTIGLELLEELPEIGTVLVPLSGGGLLSGIALALKSADPAIHVVGVSMERGAVMVRSQRAGAPLAMEEEETVADALCGGIGLQNRFTFRMVRDLSDELLLVTEAEIWDAMTFALEHHHLAIEGAGAVGVAPLLRADPSALVGDIVVIVSGSNVDPHLLHRLVLSSGKGAETKSQ